MISLDFVKIIKSFIIFQALKKYFVNRIYIFCSYFPNNPIGTRIHPIGQNRFLLQGPIVIVPIYRRYDKCQHTSRRQLDCGTLCSYVRCGISAKSCHIQNICQRSLVLLQGIAYRVSKLEVL